MQVLNEDHVKHRNNDERDQCRDKHPGDLDVAHGFPQRAAFQRQRDKAADGGEHCRENRSKSRQARIDDGLAQRLAFATFLPRRFVAYMSIPSK